MTKVNKIVRTKGGSMSTIHLMCGYIGFGKTTVAKQIEQETGARRFTPDDVMIELFGTDVGDDFMEKANRLSLLRTSAIKQLIILMNLQNIS